MRWNPYYHGSPYRGLDLANFEGNIFFLTPSLSVASQYTKVLPASGRRPKKSRIEDAETIYTIDVDLDPSEIFDTRNPEHKNLYAEIRAELKQTLDPDDWPSRQLVATPSLPDSLETVSGFFPDFGSGLNIIPILKELGFRAMWVSEGSQGASLGLFYPQDAKIVDVKSLKRNPDFSLRQLEREYSKTGSTESLQKFNAAKVRAGLDPSLPARHLRKLQIGILQLINPDASLHGETLDRIWWINGNYKGYLVTVGLWKNQNRQAKVWRVGELSITMGDFNEECYSQDPIVIGGTTVGGTGVEIILTPDPTINISTRIPLLPHENWSSVKVSAHQPWTYTAKELLNFLLTRYTSTLRQNPDNTLQNLRRRVSTEGFQF